jgi:predicted kinase
MVGLPGAGKSYFAERFAETFKASFVSLDLISQKIFSGLVGSLNEVETTSRTAEYLLDELLKTRQTIIYDGHANSRSRRDLLTKKARSFGYEPLFVWVQTDLVTAQKRISRPNANKQIMSIEQFQAAIKHFSQPHSSENTVVISGRQTYTNQLKIVLKYLSTN